MRWCVPFNKLSKHDAAQAGGKGASLGEMTQAGIPVPPGFVVTAQTFDHFLAETDLTQEIDAILATVAHDNIATVEHASMKIQGLIREAQMPRDRYCCSLRASQQPRLREALGPCCTQQRGLF